MTNRVTAWFNGRRLALTIARRSMRRNLLQSLLIILIIGVPVAAGSAGVIFLQSQKATPSETATLGLGRTQARFTANVPPGDNVYQRPDSDRAFGYKSGQYLPPGPGNLVNPTTLYPKGSWVIERIDSTPVKTRTGVGNLKLIEGNVWSPEMAGRYNVLAGHIPTANNQVMVTPAALQRIGTKIGSTLKVPTGNNYRTFKIVGTIRAAEFSNEISAVFARAAAISGATPDADLGSFSFYLGMPKPQTQADDVNYHRPAHAVTWRQVVDFNKQGIGVYSRSVILNPPAPSEVPFNKVNQADESSYNSISSYVLGGLILIPVILLPIFVLAGSAFAFGARRQQRSLAVLSSLGAKRSLLRFITIANGIWLGLLGGALGLVLGLPLAEALLEYTSGGSKLRYPGFHVNPFIEGGILLGGAFIGAIVSVIPAISAAKVDVLATLRGTRQLAKVKVRTGIFSLILIAVGAGIVILGLEVTLNYLQHMRTSHGSYYSSWKENVKLWAPPVGSIIVILGLILGSGWLLKFLRLVLSGFGMAAKYAANDLIYNRRRYQGIIAAVIATSFVGATAISLVFSLNQNTNEQYRATMPKNQLSADADWAYNATLGSGVGIEPYRQALAQSEAKLETYLASASSVAETNSAGLVNRHEPFYKTGYATGLGGGNPKLGAEGQQPVIAKDLRYICPNLPQSAWFAEFNRLMKSGKVTELETLATNPRFFDCDALTAEQDVLLVGDVKDLNTVLGRIASAQAKQTLQSGGAVSFRRGFVVNEKTVLNWHPSGWAYYDGYNGDQAPREFQASAQPSKTVSLATTYEQTPNRSLSVMISPETAKKLGIDYSPAVLFVNYAHDLTFSQKDQLQAEIGGFQMDDGYPADPQANAWWVLLAVAFFVIAATGIALGLAQIEATADRSTLVAVGAPRRFRAKVLALQALMLTLLGTFFGAAVGFYLSYRMLTINGVDHFRVAPWQYSLLVVGIPLVTSIGFWLGTPRKEPFKARLAIE